MAKTDTTVLLLGESGTGKDLLARYMHGESRRKDKHFLKINCAALPKELLESELFGYKGGAFTGASPKGKIGLFTLADGGTVLLDEIAEIPLQLQPKLLQVIEEQKFTPIGSQEVKEINVRIIAATNRDLKNMIQEGLFREDLYYRLYVLSLKLLPLRERIEDIPLLINFFLQKYARIHSRRVELSREALEHLKAYPWPGNVRELKHMVEHLVVIAPEPVIKLQHLPNHISSTATPPGNTLTEALERVERDLIIRSYRKWGSSYKVARTLGISQSSANRKIRKYVYKESH